MNKGRGKNHRIFAAFLCVCMLLTLPGLSDIFPAAAAGQEESFQQENIITAFFSLPKEVKEQTVSIGTDIDELKLPVELTVYLSRESSKQITEESGQENTEQKNTEQENTEQENNGGSDDIEENFDTESEKGQDIQPKGSALFGEQEETFVISGVTWQSKPAYDGNTKGAYLFSAVLPESYTLAESVSLPEITVTVEDNGTDAVIQPLIGRIMALPDSEEYLAQEPDTDNWEEDDDAYEKAYAEWMDGLYEYAGEALAIQEEYEALTEEEQAQISQDMADKLAAWVEIAKQVAESGIMPAAANGTHVHNGITFQAWSKTNSLPTTAGNYYLTNDVTLNSYYEIPGNINLCLCGHKIEGSVSQGMIRVNRYALNIYDCQGAGRVYCSGINNPIQVSQNGVLSLYGGTVQAAERSAIPIGTGSGDNTGGTVNIYSGASVIGGTNGIYVNPNLQSSKVNIYGGTISGTPPINMKNGNGCITIYGDADISSISTVTSVIAAGAGQSGLSKTYTIAYTGVQNGTIVVKGSTDNTHYKLEHTTYTLCPENGNLTARVVYKVTLAGNGGSGTQLVSYGSGIETPLPTDWTKVGYTFGGWYENSGFTGNKVTSISATATGDKTYYAKWTANKYTVTYNKNSGTIANESNYTSYTYGTGLTLPTPTRTGYTFGGWYENSGFTGSKVTSIPANATGNKTYYAKWTVNKYTVTYNKNNGTIANESNYTSYTYGTGLTLPVPTRTGYTFGGWYENSGFTGNKVTSISTTATGNKTYYAKWTANTYTVKYNGNGNTGGSTADSSHTYGTEKALTANGYEKKYTVTFNHNYTGSSNTTRTAAYTFAGWNTKTGGTGTSYADKASVRNLIADNGATVTLYAQWTPTSVTYTPTRTGYTFGGWYTGSACSGSRVDNNGAYTPSGNITLYAKWTVGTYRVTFDYQGADSGNTTQSATVTYDAAYGTLPTPEKTGYVFKGWYTSKNGQGTQVKTTTIVKTASDHTLYAYWKDETAPDAPVLQNGKTLPEGWTNTWDTIPLKLYDSVGVSRLLVSVDNSPYEVSGFSGGTGSINYDYAVSDGEHTYQFKAVDAAGNPSEASSLFTLKLDKTKPVIGTITYENKTANLWDWIIGRTSMIVHVPVTDTGSGVSEISYTLTPKDAAGNSDGSNAVYTAEVTDGEATIKFDADFQGTIAVTCTDAVGNAADGVTIGANAGGVIVEDHAPKITVCADRSPSDLQQTPQGGVGVSEEYYDSSPALIVTVKDDTDNVITGGIAAITYQVGDGTEKPVTIDTSALQAQVIFTIPASEIPAGITEIMVMASDNAGNKTKELVTVKVKGPEKQPEAEIDYRAEKLTELVSNGIYSINDTKITADEEGCIPIDGSWLGNTLNIVKKGNGTETFDSQTQSLSIPARPQKPAPTGVDVSTAGGTGKLIGLTAGVTYEVSADGGKTWMTKMADGSGEITGLVPGTYIVRVKAADFNFVSENSEPAAIGVYRVKVTFIANDETYKEILVDYEGTLTEIPSVPLKEDAGDQLYIGEWCSDGQGTPAVFTNITADMTVYAVYTTAYTVTLQGGTGYILSPAGSASPVKEGGSFTFCFALENGYQTTGSFTVKVNDEKVELTEENTYTITDIRENQTVMVEGVEKKPTGGSSGPSGGGSFNPPDGGDNGDDPEPKPQPKPTPQPKPEPQPKPTPQPSEPSQPQQSSSTNPPEQPQPTDAQNNRPTDTQNNQPEDRQEPESTGTPEESEKPSETGNEQLPNGGRGQTVPAAIDDGNIVVSGEAVATGNAEGMMDTSTVLELGEGAVIVTVVCEEQEYTAGVADTAAVANTVLTPEQLELVNNGETIEIRIDVKDILGQVPKQDKEVIADGMDEYQKEVLGLTFGTYVDISMFIKIGEGDWNAITTTEEPIEIIIGIPEKLQEEGRTYYIIRAHDGEHTFMEDMDDEPGTITVSTDRFSSYAIAYVEAEKTADGSKCRLCHICPTFLGICYFVWLAIIILMVIMMIIVIILLRKKKERVCKEN